MPFNILIGGAAGQGIDTTAAIFEKLLKQAGYFVFTSRDFMSRVRGGHNFILIRFGSEVITSHSYRLDGIVALNDETVSLHLDQLSPDGFILGDVQLKTDDRRTLKIDMARIAKELGNARAAGNVATGALLRLFGLDLAHVPMVLGTFIKAEYLEINQKAVRAGYDEAKTRFSAKPGDFAGRMILSGNSAVALGALAAGLQFYSAYPMSPSTSIMEYLAGQGQACGVLVEQAEDEIAGINMAIGASFAGVRAMTGTSGGGFSLKVEALGLAGMAEIPLVVIDVQRPGPATGLPTRTEQSDLRFVISAAQGEFPRMVIALKNQADAFYQTCRAFNLADKYQLPVILLSDQYLADSSTAVPPFDLSGLDRWRQDPAVLPAADYRRYLLTENGISPRVLPGDPRLFATADSDEHDEWGRITESADMRRQMMDKRLRKLLLLRQELQEPEWIGPEDFDVLLLGWGSMHGPLAEAVGLLNAQPGQQFAALVFGDIYPLPTALLLEKAGLARRIVNVEQNATGQMAGLIREHTGIQCVQSILKYDGRQLSGEEIAAQARAGGG